MFIKVQKVIRFVPVCNLFLLFCWLGTYIRSSNNRKRDLLLPFLKIMLCCMAVCITGALTVRFCANETIDLIANVATIYLASLIVAFGSVRVQERILQLRKENRW